MVCTVIALGVLFGSYLQLQICPPQGRQCQSRPASRWYLAPLMKLGNIMYLKLIQKTGVK